MGTEPWNGDGGQNAPPRTPQPAPTSSFAPPSFGAAPPPSSPPRRHRPDTQGQPSRHGFPLAPPVTPAQGGSGPTTTGPVPERPAESSQSIKPTPGWGWRALAAFVAGGVLAGGGFAVGLLAVTDDNATDASATTAQTTPVSVSTTVAEEESAPPVLELDGDTNVAAAVADVLGPSVVQIETELGIGSGVVYEERHIITNHHVIDGSSQINVRLSDGRRLVGTLLGSDARTDVAVVQVEEDLPVANLATGEKAEVGQSAIAIGSPFRLQQTVTQGIVSAVDRPVPTIAGGFTAMIQTDAPINPGNSGGALADRSGRVIGINTAIQTDGATTTNAGVGFAIPIDTAVSVADRIVAGEPIEAGFLGVLGGESSDGSAGVELVEITPGSAADDAGLQVGDLIVSVDGAPVTLHEELAGLIVARSPGDVVEIEIVRNGSPMTLTATLGTRP